MTISTIQVKEETKKTLQSMKLHPRETYEEVIERMIEDLSELNEETILFYNPLKTQVLLQLFVRDKFAGFDFSSSFFHFSYGLLV